MTTSQKNGIFAYVSSFNYACYVKYVRLYKSTKSTETFLRINHLRNWHKFYNRQVKCLRSSLRFDLLYYLHFNFLINILKGIRVNWTPITGYTWRFRVNQKVKITFKKKIDLMLVKENKTEHDRKVQKANSIFIRVNRVDLHSGKLLRHVCFKF